MCIFLSNRLRVMRFKICRTPFVFVSHFVLQMQEEKQSAHLPYRQQQQKLQKNDWKHRFTRRKSEHSFLVCSMLICRTSKLHIAVYLRVFFAQMRSVLCCGRYEIAW